MAKREPNRAQSRDAVACFWGDETRMRHFSEEWAPVHRLGWMCCGSPMEVVGRTSESEYLVRWCGYCGKVQFGYHLGYKPQTAAQQPREVMPE